MAGKHPRHVRGLPEHASINVTLDSYSLSSVNSGLGEAMDEALWALAAATLPSGFPAWP